MPHLVSRSTLMLAQLLTLAACTTGGNGGPDGGPNAAAGSGGAASGARAEIVLSQTTVAPAASIPVTLRVINGTAEPLTLEFTSGQRFDLWVLRPDGESAYTWSADKLFMQALGQETIAPGDTLAFEETVPAPAEAGEYRVVGSLTASNRSLADTATVTVAP